MWEDGDLLGEGEVRLGKGAALLGEGAALLDEGAALLGVEDDGGNFCGVVGVELLPPPPKAIM